MKEINRYRLALIQYKLSRYLPKSWFKTSKGLCYHFIGSLSNNKSELSTLFSLSPPYYKRPFPNVQYWFTPGDLQPRIDLLKQSIKICKNKGKFDLMLDGVWDANGRSIGVSRKTFKNR